MSTQNQLLAVTPLDGRYANKVQPLTHITSEYGLITRRLNVEIEWFLYLNSGLLPDVSPLGESQIHFIKELGNAFSIDDAIAVKSIEETTNHDVKAIEIWLRHKLETQPELENRLELIHFGITSEDINNLAYAAQVRDVRDHILLPTSNELYEILETHAAQYSTIPMLARTHGQPATPTTLGKELRNMSVRLQESSQRLASVKIKAKFNGATGNYNALVVAYPDVDWIVVNNQFIEKFAYEPNHYTTQIEPHDWMAVFCNELTLSNTILTDICRDIWLYISYGYFTQELKANEVGSSTMPHKVNPIDFENAEANFGIANAILSFLAVKLPISRMQRDLSDSSALRSLSEAFGHTLIAHQSIKKGLSKIQANPQNIAKDLENEWSVLTEAVQTTMRKYGSKDAYVTIKNLTRGKALTRDDYMELVESIELPATDKQFLKNLTPQTYLGLAIRLAQSTHGS
jgi:adenylosuccinate lyase